MDGGPPREFGKRRPVVARPAAPPVKRSGHVALLLMGTFAVGGGAYALMPRQNCTPAPAGAAAPALPPNGTACAPGSGSGSGSSGGHGGSWSSRTSFFSSDSSSGRSSSGASMDSASGGVTRGGFGSFARAFSGHFSSGS